MNKGRLYYFPAETDMPMTGIYIDLDSLVAITGIEDRDSRPVFCLQCQLRPEPVIVGGYWDAALMGVEHAKLIAAWREYMGPDNYEARSKHHIEPPFEIASGGAKGSDSACSGELHFDYERSGIWVNGDNAFEALIGVNMTGRLV